MTMDAGLILRDAERQIHLRLFNDTTQLETLHIMFKCAEQAVMNTDSD